MTPPPDKIPSGICECGCGGKTKIADQARPDWGQYAGYPMRFIHGHSARGRTGSKSHKWKGGRIKRADGYWLLFMPEHHLASTNGYVLEHRYNWEQANGRELQSHEQVHHLDGNKENNDPSNLVTISKSDHHKHHASDRAEMSRRSKAALASPEVRKRISEAAKRGWIKRKAGK
jgi:hypothetical protein